MVQRTVKDQVHTARGVAPGADAPPSPDRQSPRAKGLRLGDSSIVIRDPYEVARGLHAPSCTPVVRVASRGVPQCELVAGGGRTPLGE